jgi:hypothetical protein
MIGHQPFAVHSKQTVSRCWRPVGIRTNTSPWESPGNIEPTHLQLWQTELLQF